MVGAFYYQEHNNYTYTSATPSPTTVIDLFLRDPDTNAKSYAAFTQVTYNTNEAWSITGGIRYTKDKKDETGATIITPVTGAPTVVNNLANLTFDNTSGKLGIQWNVTDKSLLYASASNAYKAGGYFDGLNNVYQPEKLTAYEVGSKNRFFDSRVQVNLAAFYYDYRDFQATYVVTLPGGARVAATGNAQKARSEGLEAETIYLVTPTDRIGFQCHLSGRQIRGFHSQFGAASELQWLHDATLADIHGDTGLYPYLEPYRRIDPQCPSAEPL